MEAVTTLNLFRYRGFGAKFWALSQMGLAHGGLRGVRGVTFYKLLGTGRQGFSIRPDWAVYGLLQVWEGEALATEFFDSHPRMQAFLDRCDENLRIYLRPLRSAGLWDGKNPFECPSEPLPGIQALAVLTRASLRKRHLWNFWNFVPRAQAPLNDKDGLVYTKGIGETPLVDMATFSLWEDLQRMQEYAYGAPAHLEAIRLTRELGWYREELFARFQPYRIEGSWRDIPGLQAFKESLGNTPTRR
jgi:spheroidene monooxygenase